MPRAETEKDLQAEREIIAVVMSCFPAKYDGYLHIGEMSYRLDGVLTKKHEHGYAVPKVWYEAKDREIAFGQYRGGLLISASKLAQAKLLTTSTGLPSVIFSRFTDGVVASVGFDRYRGDIRIGGRPHRPGFDHDIEPVVLYAWEDFRILHDPREAA